MKGSASRVVALVAVWGCFLASSAPASALDAAPPVEASEAGSAVDAEGSGAVPAESGAGSDVDAEGSGTALAESGAGSDVDADGSGTALAESASDLSAEPLDEPAAPSVDSRADLRLTAVAVRNAWRGEAEDPVVRARRARRAALHYGMWNFDPAARALIGPDLRGAGLEQAQAAVALSPDLPAARMALARETWMEGDSPIAAARTAFGALLAIPRHFESSIWFSVTALYICALALMAGGLLTLVVFAALSFGHAAHDIGDLISRAMPTYARFALLGALMLIPLALNHGWLGFGLTLFAVGLIYGGARQRLALCVAAIAVLVGAFPLARLTGKLVTAYSEAPIEAALFATDGFALPGEMRQLESFAERDPLAAMALAVASRRSGDLIEADAQYRSLLERDSANPAAANNAANVKLELGQMETAIALYRRSLQANNSATVLFNLSQAQGQAFKLDDVGPTLEAAQRLDSSKVAELTLLQGSDVASFTVDLPLPRRMLWERILASRSGESFAAELRGAVAPGALGESGPLAAGAFASIAVISLLAAPRWKRSHRCARCGRRMCPRCDPALGAARDCEGCDRLFQRPETTDRAMRAARINALRARERRLARFRLIASILVPGVAGALARRPLASFVGALSAAIAITAIVWRNGVTPDPLIAGAAAPMLFGLISALALICYGVSVALSLAERGGR